MVVFGLRMTFGGSIRPANGTNCSSNCSVGSVKASSWIVMLMQPRRDGSVSLGKINSVEIGRTKSALAA